MPSAWVLGPLIIKSTWIITIVSIIAGGLFYRYYSRFSQAKKKRMEDSLFSLLLTFIFTYFFGKIVFHFSLFFQDPPAILAYPSGKNEFYLAAVLTFAHALFLLRKKQMDGRELLFSGMMVFFPALLLKNFLDAMLLQNGMELPIIVKLFVLSVFVLLFAFQTVDKSHVIYLWLAWLLSEWLLTFIAPFPMLFGVIVATWFIFTLMVAGLILEILTRRKVVIT
ncbi:hypothetical protein GCM10007216_26550 [Thalassobacillus devorans]|uniref:Uncharacterized protein n=1 Tax=Thalassobacillus devorans TaxID=279813 RepID=A0ABQ1PCF6_9BACI|nr:hypothetical protein [Thalassobacillus devorans]NIK29156.1 hypothetical protein [Thalassobacillus devorans]GGC94511.1 hypothetical protein GCM10007216_26550 [Thalassobacillus devorans]